jgi:hypothetical protein
MSNWNIKQVAVISGDGVGLTTVGINGVVKIIDMSEEHGDHTDYIYEAFDKDGRILGRIINCPVDISYGEV